MESYVQFNQRSDVEFYTRHPEREDLPQLLQHQAQLPSFRDIIPPHLQPVTEIQPPQTSQITQGFEPQSDILTSSVQDHPATSRPLVTSQTYSQGSSMPSLTGEFEDMNVRTNDTMFSTPSQPMGTMDRSTSWIPATQYQSMPAAYAQNTQRVSQIGTQQIPSRTSPNLPPIRDINQQRTASYDPTYGPSNGQMTQVSQLGSYPQMYATSQPTASDLDTTAFARGMSYHDGQYARFTASYPQASRTYQSADYTRYNAAPYDAYRYNSGYRASFGDLNYAPHAMVGSQPAAYGIQGDLSGTHNRRRRGNLPKPVTDILRSWFHEHLDHPYPSEEDKQIFIQKTGLTISQISNWFINARRRHWPALKQNRDQARNSALRRSDSGGASI